MNYAFTINSGCSLYAIQCSDYGKIKFMLKKMIL
jgi:hypothetical protein